MEMTDELIELKGTVSRAVSAAFFSMDYHILRIILDASKDTKTAINQKNYSQAQYLINRCFWDIGIYIKHKLKHYTNVEPEFFAKISENISKHLNLKDPISFTPKNLMHCYKLVELADAEWFGNAAYKFSWDTFVKGLEQSNSFDDLNLFLGQF